MAEYKEIHGSNIEIVSSDPSNPVVGQVWYNTSSQVLKGFSSSPAGTWATSTAMNTGRASLGGAGTKAAAVVFGGQGGPPAPGYQTLCETWNGSAWTEIGDTSNARSGLAPAQSGTTTAGLVFGGDGVIASTEEWLKPGQITVSFTVS